MRCHIDGFGQAMAELSRMSNMHRVSDTSSLPVKPLVDATEWCMLKRECHNILDSLKGHRRRVTGETFADDNLDAADIIRCAPVIVLEQLLSKYWEPHGFGFAALGQIYKSSGQSSKFTQATRSTVHRLTGAMSNHSGPVCIGPGCMAVETSGPFNKSAREVTNASRDKTERTL